MKPSKDPKYVHIDERCWQRFVDPRWPTLKWLLIALSVDPLEAPDWEMGEADRKAPIALGHFADQSHARFRQALETIAVCIEGEGELRPIFQALANYDYRLALWCAATRIRALSGRIHHLLMIRENQSMLQARDCAVLGAAAVLAEGAVRGDIRAEEDVRSASPLWEDAKSGPANIHSIIYTLCFQTAGAVELLMREGSKPFTPPDALLRASDAIQQGSAYIVALRGLRPEDSSAILASIRRSMAQGCMNYPLLPAAVDCRDRSP